MKKRPPISDQLRRAIENCGQTRYQISKQTGIAQSILSRFLLHGAGLSLDSIDKIGECLELEITTRTRKPRKRKGR